MSRRVNLMALLSFALLTPLAAEEEAPPRERLALIVHGRACVPADQVDVEVVVEGQAEEGRVAEKRHRDKLAAVVAALEELQRKYDPKDPEAEEKKDGGPKIPGFSIELREGRSMLGVRHGSTAEAQGTISVATCVILRMKGIADVPRPALRKRLAAILDAAVDAGADLGAGGVGARPAFRFRAKDNEALREAAHKDALEKGRSRAARLAKLAGRELGRLSTIAERAWRLRAGAGGTDAVGFDAVVGRLGNNVPNNHEMTVSTTEIDLEVELALDFDLR